MLLLRNIFEIFLSIGSLMIVVVKAAWLRCFPVSLLLFCSLHWLVTLWSFIISNCLYLLHLNPLPLPSMSDWVVSLFLVHLSLLCTVQSSSLWAFCPSGNSANHCTSVLPNMVKIQNKWIKPHVCILLKRHNENWGEMETCLFFYWMRWVKINNTFESDTKQP